MRFKKSHPGEDMTKVGETPKSGRRTMNYVKDGDHMMTGEKSVGGITPKSGDRLMRGGKPLSPITTRPMKRRQRTAVGKQPDNY